VGAFVGVTAQNCYYNNIINDMHVKHIAFYRFWIFLKSKSKVSLCYIIIFHYKSVLRAIIIRIFTGRFNNHLLSFYCCICKQWQLKCSVPRGFLGDTRVFNLSCNLFPLKTIINIIFLLHTSFILQNLSFYELSSLVHLTCCFTSDIVSFQYLLVLNCLYFCYTLVDVFTNIA
jgi:hypothetical protein